MKCRLMVRSLHASVMMFFACSLTGCSTQPVGEEYFISEAVAKVGASGPQIEQINKGTLDQDVTGIIGSYLISQSKWEGDSGKYFRLYKFVSYCHKQENYYSRLFVRRFLGGLSGIGGGGGVNVDPNVSCEVDRLLIQFDETGRVLEIVETDSRRINHE